MHLFAIDQGTTSARSVRSDGTGRTVAGHQQELARSDPADTYVEQDPERRPPGAELWNPQ